MRKRGACPSSTGYGGFGLTVVLDPHGPHLSRADAKGFMARAHELCPCSNTKLAQVAVSYPLDEEFERINREVFGSDARIAFLERVPRERWPDVIAEAEVLL